MFTFQDISISDLSKGIDQRSAPNAIPDGFAEDLQNVITNSNGFLAKRAGYEGYYGYLPVRVVSITHSGTSISFTLDSSIDVSNIASTPIVVYGRLAGAHTGDFSTTAAGQYYTSFTDGTFTTLSAPSDTETISGSTHGVTTDEVLLQITQATDTSSADNTFIIADSLKIANASTWDVVVAGTVPTDTSIYTMIADKSVASGTAYVHPDATILAGTTDTITIAAGTHSLSSFNIIPNVFYLDGTDYVKIAMPDVTVNSSTGSVVVTINNSTGSNVDVRVVLAVADSADVEVKTISASTTDTIVISTADPYNFTAVYQSAGSVNTLIMPDSIVYDNSAETLTITIQNSAVTAQAYKVFWEPVTISSTTLTVVDNGGISVSYTESVPQLTIWGLNHGELYDTAVAQEGHVTHIDTYRTDTQSRVVAGLGGNLFAATTRAEADAAYKIPTYNVDLEGTLSADALVAPLFVTTGDTADRSNGNVTASDVVDNKALITAVTYVSSGVVDYTLSLTSKSGTLGASVSVTSGVEDYLTVTGMAHSIHNGTFKITAVNDSTNVVRVANSLVTLDAFDETGALGRGGIFTDRVTLTANSKFQVGDTLTSTIFSGFSPTVKTSSTTTLVLSGVTGRAFITAGTTLYPIRECAVLPLQSTMANFVKGDMLAVGDLTRQARVLSVNNSSDVTVSTITVASGVATVVTSGAHGLSAGDYIVILRSDVAGHNSEHMVTAVTNTTTFTYASSAASATGGVILGKTVAIDETLTIQDDASDPTQVSVVGRWVPIEAPTSADDLPATTYIQHLSANDYDEQLPLRSTMVQDNLYLTNGDDEVYKFDGLNIYQAGLFRWQPQLFAQVDTTTASLALDGTVGNVSAVAANKFTVGTGEAAQFAVGDIITHDNNAAVYTVQSVDTVNNLVYTTGTISGAASGDIKLVSRYKYYFRLNAIDYNNNIIASAATGADDFIVDLTAAGQIRMRLVGMPVWGNYDYDAIELEVYRTLRGSSGPFYRVGVKDLDFDAGAGYIDFYDSVADEFLTAVDPVSTAVGLGSELGTGWSQPLRAKYITSVDNRLILGNITDYPSLDIVLRADEGVTSVTAANMSGKKWLFRKDSTDTSTTTNMTDRATYEFKTTGDVTIVPNTDITSTATTFTVTEIAHGLVAGNWVYLFHSAAGTDKELDFAGWFQIYSKTDDTFTINFSGHTRGVGGGAATDVDRYVAATAATDIPVWIGTDGNRNLVGASTINEFTAMSRLADAINSTMRMTDTTLASPDMTDFVPWMIAQAGNDIGSGRLVIRQEKVLSTTMEVKTPAAITGASFFVKGVKQAASTEVSATADVFQSRIISSYKNQPELFDSPYGDASFSSSVIDINSADGQQITGIIPFFGDSVFAQSQVEAILVVFKTNSIYLVDVNSQQVSKIQSRGLGCTAPDSIASTRDGIMFVNNSGIYRLNRNQSITYVGRAVERIFEDSVNRDQLSVLRGHHYGVGRQYKLSVPVGDGQLLNNQVLVYDHQREQVQSATEEGAWSRFTNHAATGWANLEEDAFFSTSDGQVFRIRNEGDETDFRDDAAAVDEMVILLRAESFGDPGSRKIIANIVSHFQLRNSSMAGTELLISPDLDGVFTSAGQFDLTKTATNKVETVKSALPRRKIGYIQLKYTNSTKDEDVVLTGVDYRATLLNAKGMKERGG